VYDWAEEKPLLRYTRTHIDGCKSGDSCRKCPYWIEGRHQGKRWHQSLRTADSKTAAQLVQRAILTGKLELEREEQGITLTDAVTKFFDELTGRGAALSTIKSFRKFLTGAPNRGKLDLTKLSPTLIEFAEGQGITYLVECSTDFLSSFRQAWKVSKVTNAKQTERLKQFFNFAVSRKWIEDNPASPLKPPVGVDSVPVIPLGKTHLATIIHGCGDDEYLRTFILVMRYSGLATVDAVKLTPDRLTGHHLCLRRTKTKGWVKVLLPDVIADRLRALPLQPCGFWFWNQKQIGSRHETATGNMRRMLRPIFALVPLVDEEGNPILERGGKQKHAHPYQLRHTFVKEQLESGASLERIAELLGNTYKIVEKHYSGWVKDRQNILDETVKRAWNKKELAGY
jgi:site-specific recombinase XerD